MASHGHWLGSRAKEQTNGNGIRGYRAADQGAVSGRHDSNRGPRRRRRPLFGKRRVGSVSRQVARATASNGLRRPAGQYGRRAARAGLEDRGAAVSARERIEDMSEQDVQDWIGKQVAGNDVVLFMKGNKQMPQCGFSMQVAQILGHLGVEYKDIDVLQDMSVRDGVKAYSNWPTVPQLYVKGEFVGGCDIVREMFQAGELQDMLNAKGIAHNAQTQTA